MKHLLVGLLLLCTTQVVQAQKATLQGTITDEDNTPLDLATVLIEGTQQGTTTNTQGKYTLEIPADQSVTLVFRFTGYQTKKIAVTLTPNEVKQLDVRLEGGTLDEVEIRGREDSLKRDEVSLIKIDPKKVAAMPSAFGDFNMILATLGARSNSELSSTYSVRGGNYNENLVYVNDIVVYRPFLVRAGEQEGLSFVNPNLVSSVEFSTGGWRPEYGDKLSSVLNIQYKEPTEFSGSVCLGILNNMAHVEGTALNNKMSYVVGARRKSARYLLGTLPVEGEYLPQFIDIQSYLNFKLSSKTDIGLLTSYASNEYLVNPENRETSFGTLARRLRLFVAYIGQEQLNYTTTQNGLKLTHRFSDRFTTKLITSYMQTTEREYADVEGGYRLCEVNNAFGTPGFNECATTIGIGTNYTYQRNKLDATIWAAENRSEWRVGSRHIIGFGGRYTNERIEDVLDEYSFLDSADFVTITERINSENSLHTHRFAAYAQHQFFIDSLQTLTYGVRIGYWSLNQELWVSPMVQYAIRPRWKKDIVLRAAVGVYHQPPFYRELRNFQGEVNEDLKAQRAIHYIAGMDYVFKWYGNRNFRLVTEAYYKDLDNVVPYDVDNVRLRYYANNNAVAYVWGVDARLHGEFIRGTESWISVGVLQTKEDVLGDEQGFIRRPTDQRLNVGVYFEDHLPSNPTWRMNLNLLWATNLPFSVPNEPEFRSAFSGRDYRRVDIGFSKFIDNVRLGGGKTLLESLWIGLDVLNLLGVENVISYTWIQDVTDQQYAVPNALSARFLNLRLIAKF